jgi:4-amino-4-deoxy-L-arabinose transferase-like glycosyltransferase
MATLVYVALAVAQLNRPLMYDDANFALAARAIAETGVPYGNQGWMSERGDFSQREQWALWHPPLYIYAIGALAKVGGWTPATMRLLAVISGVATAFVTFELAREITGGPPIAKQVAGGAAVVLTMLCPLVIQSTLLLDIDFAVLLPLTLLFLLLYLRLEGQRREWLWLVPLFALMLWAKMTNPLPLIAVAAVWQTLRRKPLRAVLHLVLIGGGGAALFGLSWFLIGRWLKFPLDMPFGVNLVQWQDSAEVARRAYTSPGAFLEGLQPTVVWLGPGLVALGLVAVAVRTAQLVCTWHIRQVDLLIGVLAVLVLGYANKYAGWFPKYEVAFAPLLACLGAPLIAYAWCARPRLVSVVAAIAALATGVVAMFMVRDTWALQRTWAIDLTPATWLLTLVVVTGLAGLRWRLAAMTATVGLFGLALGWSLAVDSVQVRAAYQTDYWYGTTGTVEAAQWVNANLEPDQTYVSAKEVAIRSADQRYVDQDNLVYFLSIGRPFDGTWAGERVAAIVLWQREPYVASVVVPAMSGAGFNIVAQFDDYVVYEPV